MYLLFSFWETSRNSSIKLGEYFCVSIYPRRNNLFMYSVTVMYQCGVTCNCYWFKYCFFFVEINCINYPDKLQRFHLGIENYLLLLYNPSWRRQNKCSLSHHFSLGEILLVKNINLELLKSMENGDLIIFISIFFLLHLNENNYQVRLSSIDFNYKNKLFWMTLSAIDC